MSEQLAMFSPRELSELARAFDRAANAWGLNCGPGAICGALAIPPEWVRPHLGKFEQLGHMTPTQMWRALKSLGVRHVLDPTRRWPQSNGVVRVQFGGPWCAEGRPARAAYRYTHWVAGRRDSFSGEIWVFDINNVIGSGMGLAAGPEGWLPHIIWAGEVVPHLLPARGDGNWWITHTAELEGS